MVDRDEDGAEGPDSVGICVSGGGIRAAAFGLGALEALEEHTGLVQGSNPHDSAALCDPNRAARYLIAVSGGSYITGAISMLRGQFDRDRSTQEAPDQKGLYDLVGQEAEGAPMQEDSAERVEAAVRNVADRTSDGLRRMLQPSLKSQSKAEDDKSTSADRPVFAPGSDETEYVRRRAQYLLRAHGGVAELVAEFVLRLLINLAYLLLPIAIAGWIIGRLYQDGIPDLPHNGVGISAIAWIALFPLGIAVLCSLIPMFRSSLASGPWRKVITIGVVVALAILFLAAVPALVSLLGSGADSSATPDVAAGSATHAGDVAFVATIGAILAAFGALLTKAEPIIVAIGRFQRLRVWSRRIVRGIVVVGAALFGPLSLVAFFVWMAEIGASEHEGTSWGEVAILAGAVLAFVVISVFVEPTTWSLHPFYKRRLQSCFCLGWRKNAGLSVSERDDRLGYLWPGWTFPERPELIISAAANISTFGGSPAGQNVLPFAISQHEIGFTNGWRPGGSYRVDMDPGVGPRLATGRLVSACWNGGHKVRLYKSGRRNLPNLTVPAAVAITGAALSPSMGKRTIAPIRMLLAMFNLRLGVWLPNPANQKVRKSVIEDDKFEHSPGARHLLGEYFGLNDRKSKFVYVSDGGHYENLGLVETLRRGCTTVYCIDASGDPPGEPRTLTEAMRLAQAELNISWDDSCSRALGHFSLADSDGDPSTNGSKKSTAPPTVRRTWTTLHFQHRDGRRGRVHVVKIGISATTPEHLRAYQVWKRTFPYDGTGNQLFRADRFDAYRELGFYSTESMLAARGGHVSRVSRRAVPATAQ